MKAVFKPNEATKVIVSGADKNEELLIDRLVNQSQNAKVSIQKRYNFNNETDGFIIAVEDIETPLPKEYINISLVEEVNDINKLFTLRFKVDNKQFFFYNKELMELVEKQLLDAGLTSIEVTSDYCIIAENLTGYTIVAPLYIPANLFRAVDPKTGKANYFSERLLFDLGGDKKCQKNF